MGYISDGFYSLFQDQNKAKEGDLIEKTEGVANTLLPELTLEMDDDALISLKKDWEKRWENSEPVKSLQKKQKENENYWLGKQDIAQSGNTENRSLADNLIFASLETFLPQATKKNPEPMVSADKTPEGQQLARSVQQMLVYLADELRLKLKVKDATRNWGLYHLGVVKLGWDTTKNDIALRVIRPQKLILDPEATIEQCKYTGDYIGEIREETASNLVKRFPEKAELITEKSKGKMGTAMKYGEWWTPEYLFWTLENDVLQKTKNPHWNYEEQKVTLDDVGQPQTTMVQGRNHFYAPEMPYVFLSIFNLGKHPFDDTSLIEQNLSNQDLINKRLKQIDKNADRTNNGIVVSGDHFTKEQARDVSEALRKGYTIWQPSGDVRSGVQRDPGQPLPNFIYQSLQDYRNELRAIFGTSGLTPEGIANEQTVRGKILVRESNGDRIGGGITEYIEQFADGIFNWMVQLIYVYYDEPHVASILGAEKAIEEITLSSAQMNKRLRISVKEGSLIPQDDLTRANQAVELGGAGLIDPIEMFDRLGFPNPRETAERLFLWRTNPMALFPNLAPAIPMMGTPEGSQVPAIPNIQPENQQIPTVEPNLLRQVPIPQ